jgi:hypothetical protein
VTLDWGFFTDESCQQVVKPKIYPGRLDKLTNQDAYVMDNGEYINLFICSEIPEVFAQEVSVYSFIMKIIIFIFSL